MALLRALDQAEWNEIRMAAQGLKGLGGDAVSVLRRAIREAQEPDQEPEREDRAKAILDGLAWLSAPDAKRPARVPKLTPLAKSEAEAIHAAIVAVEAGVPVATIVSAELEVEEMFQAPEDRRAGRVVPWEKLPSILDILKREPFALFSYRIRRAFMDWLPKWLPTAKPGDKATLLDALDTSKPVDARKEDALAARVFYAVATFRELGLTRADAMKAVARGLDPWTDPVGAYGALPPAVMGDEPPVLRPAVIPREALVARDFARRGRGLPSSGLPRHVALPVAMMKDDPLPPLSEGQVQVLLGRAEKNLGVARKVAFSRRRVKEPRKREETT